MTVRPFYQLCIETATEVCSVALGKDDVLLTEDNIDRKNSHTETLTLQIDHVLSQAGISYKDLGGVTISSGPGSYTGLRVGASVAKGICYAWDLPMVAISTLYGLAAGVRELAGPNDFIIPMIDARRKEVYTAQYSYSLEELKEVHNLILEEGIFRELHPGKAVICGNGAFKCEGIDMGIPFEIINTSCRASQFISKGFEMHKKGQTVDIAYFSPYYHKAPNVTVSKKNVLRK